MKVPEGFLDGEIRDSFYVEIMMKKAWAAQLEVLYEVDRLCQKHNIKYFADWGTLLGAVRHKGFIPWDDDMDITMKREDYTRFCLIAQKEMPEGYEIVNMHTEKGWDLMLTRVVNSKRIRFDEEHLSKFHGCPWVVGLDIFPLDYVAPTKDEDELQVQLIKIIGAAVKSESEWSAEPEMKKQTIESIENLCGVKFRDDLSLSLQLLKLGERISMMYSEEESTHVAIMTHHAGHRPTNVYPKEYYEESIRVPFEYFSIPIPVKYDEILKMKYGNNYMLPRITRPHEYPFYKKQKAILYKQMRKKQ